ncbi:hypothetical protein R6Q59_019432 [Mikania micrantha]|uniref:Protein CHUP1, chloroplastic n=1 Tax=Mikania micrantha TaxID=192012 RepID=A0A5N6LYI6_9ASTR|nr:hypothetical protein E3N88_34266 [Mikania micrantha]
MPSGDDVFFLKRELEASLVKIASLEKENHELKQETSRLKAQINTLKAHDLERKSILWKKLQSTMDGGKVTEEPPQKPKLQIDVVPLKKSNSETPKPPPSPPQWLQRRVTAPPPPPPPVPSLSPVGSRTVRRAPAVMELYRSLMKRDSCIQKENKNSGTGGVVTVSCPRDMIGEIENRSTYVTSIRSDVEKYGERLNAVIREIESAVFMEISEVEAFVKWLDGELSCLVDERAVLKHFTHWPEPKADALREAAFTYRDLKNLQSEVLAFNTHNPLIQSLNKMQALQDRIESKISGLERTREGTSKRYKDLHIPWQWLMDTGLIGQIKLSSLKLARECMRRIAKELKCNASSSREGDLLLQGVRFAFRVHQFAGGFDTETMHAFEELKEIGSSRD